MPDKAAIIASLQKDLLFQAFKPVRSGSTMEVDMGALNQAFPNGHFPLGAVHEFACGGMEDIAATGGFIAGILSTLMKNGGVAVWIGRSPAVFPPALQAFGVEADKLIVIDLPKEKDRLWAMEEALKCPGLAAVIAELKELDFTSSRRLQLAVEQSRVTGFVIRHSLHTVTTACVTRWKICASGSALPGNLPGVGFPSWNVSLLKVRNGRPGVWQIEWQVNRFVVAGRPATGLLVQRKEAV